ncbi:MAG: hypothetical protein NTY48_03525 [Candidatus Diapherotrites archaeon]|nr:hypothetical protein [Candidatus Diapherotrites archaeon]
MPINRRKFILKLLKASAGTAFLGGASVRLQGGTNNLSPKIKLTRKTAREQIEEVPAVDKLEVAMVKKIGHPGKLFDVSNKRQKTSVEFLQGPVSSRLLRAELHTHPIYAANEDRVYAASTYTNMFSTVDLKSFIKSLSTHENLRFSHVVPIDENGKVVGYISLMASKKLRQELKSNPKKVEELIKIIESIENLPKYKKYIALLVFLRNIEKYGFKIRGTSMSGRKLNAAYLIKR